MSHSEPLIPLPIIRGVWQWLTEPSPALQDPEQRRRARLLSSLQLAIIVLGFGGAILPALIGAMSLDGYFAITTITIAVLCGLYILGRTRYYSQSAVLTIILTSAATFVISYNDTANGSLNLLVYLLLPVMLSQMLLTVRITLWVALSQIAVMVAGEIMLHKATLEDNWLLFVSLTSALVLLSMRHQALEEHDRRRKLSTQEERYRLIALVSNDALYDLDLRTDQVWRRNGQRQLFADPEGNRDWWATQVHPDDRAGVQASLEAVLKSSHNWWTSDYRMLTASGDYAYVVDRAFIVRDAGHRPMRIIGAISDVTERKHAEQAEREQRLLAEALVDTSFVINNTLDQQRILEAIMKTVQQVVPFDTASIMLIEDGVASVVLHRGFEQFAPDTDVSSMQLVIDDTPNLREMLHTHKPIIIPDTRELDWWKQGNRVSDWIRSYLGIPICVGPEVIGFINLDSAQPHAFTATHARRLEVFASQVAIAINNAQLYTRVSQHASELEERVRQRTEALHQSTERVEAILNNSSDAIIFTDSEGRIQQANFTFDELLLYHPDDLLRQPLGFIVDTASEPVLDAQLDAVRRSGNKVRFEVVARRKDGATFQAEIGLAPVRNGKLTTGIVCTMRDITPHKLAEENLRLALKRERELGELKSRFVVMASHEFRTPLATIQAAADVLRHYAARMTEEQRENSFEKIEQQVRHMTAILDDILLVGRLEAGVVQLNLVAVQVAVFLREVMEDFQQSTPTHPIVLDHGESDIESAVDQKLLRQIITNLLSNAVKYSPEGCAVHCAITCTADAFTFSVRDTGIGIPPDDQPHLFEAFHRGSNVDTRPGSGLGLAITYQAVEMLGGAISFESVVNQGTTFTVTIPVIDPASTELVDNEN